MKDNADTNRAELDAALANCQHEERKALLQYLIGSLMCKVPPTKFRASIAVAIKCVSGERAHTAARLAKDGRQ